MKKIKLPNWLVIAFNIVKFAIQNRDVLKLIAKETADVFKKISVKWKQVKNEQSDGGKKITKNEAIDLYVVLCDELNDVKKELQKLKK